MDLGMNIVVGHFPNFIIFIFLLTGGVVIATSHLHSNSTTPTFSREIAVSPALPGHSGQVLSLLGPHCGPPANENYF